MPEWIIRNCHGADRTDIPEQTRMELVRYLKCGYVVHALAILDFDEAGQGIDVHETLTDGKWLWPYHLAHRIEFGQLHQISTEFLQHLVKMRLEMVKLDEGVVSQIERYIDDGLLNV